MRGKDFNPNIISNYTKKTGGIKLSGKNSDYVAVLLLGMLI